MTSDKNIDIQQLLDLEAQLANTRYDIHQLIKQHRGDTPPLCWGDDDCSTHILSMCPWRIDCDDPTKSE